MDWEASTCSTLISFLHCNFLPENGNSCLLPGFHISTQYHHLTINTSFSGCSSIPLFYHALIKPRSPCPPSFMGNTGYLLPHHFFLSPPFELCFSGCSFYLGLKRNLLCALGWSIPERPGVLCTPANCRVE